MEQTSLIEQEKSITDLGLMEIAVLRLLEIWSKDDSITTREQIIKYARKMKYSEKTYQNIRKTVQQLIDKGYAEYKNLSSIVVSLVEEAPPEPPETVEGFFEKIWKEYPLKRGKGQVTYRAKRDIKKLGFDQMVRTIERYHDELVRDHRERFMMQGSTFFNSGYLDYTDENYVKVERKEVDSGDRQPASGAETKPTTEYQYLD